MTRLDDLIYRLNVMAEPYGNHPHAVTLREAAEALAAFREAALDVLTTWGPTKIGDVEYYVPADASVSGKGYWTPHAAMTESWAIAKLREAFAGQPQSATADTDAA